jgi:putative SOS response-associated peptidase YedK
MCGCYKRPGKQKIAEAFAVSECLEAFDLDPDDNACPQSFQPVIRLSENGDRQIELMRWAFRLPDKPLFNARSEGIEKAKFWGDSFHKRRRITCP